MSETLREVIARNTAEQEESVQSRVQAAFGRMKLFCAKHSGAHLNESIGVQPYIPSVRKSLCFTIRINGKNYRDAYKIANAVTDHVNEIADGKYAVYVEFNDASNIVVVFYE